MPKRRLGTRERRGRGRAAASRGSRARGLSSSTGICRRSACASSASRRRRAATTRRHRARGRPRPRCPAEPGLADEQHEVVREEEERLDPRAFHARATPRGTRRTSVSTGLSPKVDGAPGAERPAPGPRESHSPRRPASHVPRSVAGPGRSPREHEASPSTRRSPQRTGCRSSRRSAVIPRADEAGGETVVAGRAPVAPGPRRGIRRLASLGAAARSAHCSSAPRPDRRPRAACEDGGSGAHRHLRVRSSPHARAYSVPWGFEDAPARRPTRARPRPALSGCSASATSPRSPRRSNRRRFHSPASSPQHTSTASARPTRAVRAAHARGQSYLDSVAGCAGATSTSPTSSPAA